MVIYNVTQNRVVLELFKITALVYLRRIFKILIVKLRHNINILAKNQPLLAVNPAKAMFYESNKQEYQGGPDYKMCRLHRLILKLFSILTTSREVLRTGIINNIL